MEWELPLVLTVLFLFLGILIAYISINLLGITSSPTVAGLIFLPLIVTLLFSDRIAEVNAFGVQAKIREAAETPVSQDASSVLPVSESELLGAEAPERNLARDAYFAQAGHVIAIVDSQWQDLNKPQRIEAAGNVAVVVYHSLLAGAFRALVVLDDQNRPLGVFEASLFQDLLRIPIDVPLLSGEYEEFNPSSLENRALLQQTELWVILRTPARRAELGGNKAWISKRASRLEVLKTMVEKRFEVMALTDDNGAYSGIVSREDLISAILLGSF